MEIDSLKSSTCTARIDINGPSYTEGGPYYSELSSAYGTAGRAAN